MSELSSGFLSQEPEVDWSQNEKLRDLEIEISLIIDPKIKHFAMLLLSKANAFWEAPINEEGHPEDEYEPGGLIRHVKRTVRAFVLMESTMECTSHERDCAVAALLVRNVSRCYKSGKKFQYDPLHVYTIDNYIDAVLKDAQVEGTDIGTIMGVHAESLTLIARLVHTSMGFLSMIPETLPQTNLEKTVALSVLIAGNILGVLDITEVEE